MKGKDVAAKPGNAYWKIKRSAFATQPFNDLSHDASYQLQTT